MVAGRSTKPLAVRDTRPSMSAIIVRSANVTDLLAVAQLLERYMAESLGRPWEGSADALTRDMAAERVFVSLALSEREAIGFASWHRTYDVHHCANGGEVSDLFVLPKYRGRGIA